MRSRITRTALLGVALAIGLGVTDFAAAAEPVRITYHGVAGAPIVCNSDMTPALYDVGAPREGATEMALPFAVGNNSKKEVTDVVITVTGSEVPGVFWVYYTNNRGVLYPNSGVSFSLKFRPLEGDPSGTIYGGNASKILIRVTYKYKPDKGPKRDGIPLELVLMAHKR
jgi:hypothetical protein